MGPLQAAQLVGKEIQIRSTTMVVQDEVSFRYSVWIYYDQLALGDENFSARESELTERLNKARAKLAAKKERERLKKMEEELKRLEDEAEEDWRRECLCILRVGPSILSRGPMLCTAVLVLNVCLFFLKTWGIFLHTG